MTWLPPALSRSEFRKGRIDEPKYPLRKVPISSEGAEMLVLGRNDFNIPEPTHLGGAGFEAELFEIMRVRTDMSEGIWPGWFLEDHDLEIAPAAAFMSNINGIDVDVSAPETAADIVHMDDPMDLGQLLRTWLMESGARHNAVDGTGNGIFLDLIPKFNKSLANAVYYALFEAAQAKQHFGRARPEEVVGYNMTHYAEGCPKHPAYPAGHGAAAGATFAVLQQEFDMGELRDQALMACLQFSFFRSFAGVHYANDNALGFLLGYAKTAELNTVAEAAGELEWGMKYVM